MPISDAYTCRSIWNVSQFRRNQESCIEERTRDVWIIATMVVLCCECVINIAETRLIFTNTRCWNQMWCSNDEPLRVSVIELLLSSLCDGYAEHALSLLDFILSDQCSSSKPISESVVLF